MDKQESLLLMENREKVYRLLSRLYHVEVDNDLIEELKKLKPGESGDYAAGVKIMKEAIAASKDPYIDFAVDYARIFLGAGIPAGAGVVAFPFESVYTSKNRLLSQEAFEEMVKILRRNYLKKTDKDLYEDHIAYELEFMAFLCNKAKEFIAADKQKDLSANLDDQADFLKNHLLNWVLRFTSDIYQCPGTEFYKGVGKMTDAFLKAEEDLFAGTSEQP